jgi:hypothetical protein
MAVVSPAVSDNTSILWDFGAAFNRPVGASRARAGRGRRRDPTAPEFAAMSKCHMTPFYDERDLEFNGVSPRRPRPTVPGWRGRDD